MNYVRANTIQSHTIKLPTVWGKMELKFLGLNNHFDHYHRMLQGLTVSGSYLHHIFGEVWQNVSDTWLLGDLCVCVCVCLCVCLYSYKGVC